ncbi:MAG: hypothetical protein JNM56_30975 [Planctomycetia bacterium]|nr:hypothetical protein [Planctomycetia bacterium]
MPSDQPSRRKPAWLNDDTPATSKRPAATAKAESGEQAGRGWRSTESGDGASRWKSKQVKVGVGIGCGLSLLGILVWLIWLLRPLHPASLVLIGAPAEENLAVEQNVAGWHSLDRIARWVKDGAAAGGWQLPELAQDPQELTNPDEWGPQLASRGEKVVVVYLALHGGTDRDGAYFLIDAPGGEARRNRLRLRTVLDRLKQLPADKHKLLILDATQVSADWSAGMLHNDFARELEKADAAIAEVPNLVVISASSVDERSWVCEEWGESVFGHYVVEGLRGSAASDAHRVAASDLFHYVQKHVGQWAKSNRHRKQTPVLLPREDGPRRAAAMELTGVLEGGAPAPTPSGEFQPPAELKAAYERAEQLAGLTPSPAVYSPHRWREYRALLLRCEQVVRLGDPRGKAGSLFRKLGDVERDIRQLHAMNLGSAALALPMPRALGLTPNWSRADVKPFFAQVLNAKDDGERQKVWAKAQEWAVKQGGTSDLLRVEFYTLLFDQLVENPQSLSPDRLETLCRQIGGAPRPAEAQFLYMYHHVTQRMLPSGEQLPSAKLVQEALAVRRLAEETALGSWGDRERPGAARHPYCEHLYPWIKDQVEAADRPRRRGEDLLFAPPDWWGPSEKHLKEARQLYDAAGRDSRIVRDALAARDQALADLPYYAHWLANRPVPPGQQGREGDETDLKLLERFGKSAHQLAKLLEQPAETKSRGEQLKQLESWLGQDGPQAEFRQIETLYRQYCERLGDDATQDNYHMHDAALSVPPLVRPATRLKLLTVSRRISDDLNRKGAQTLESVPEADARASYIRQGRMALAVLGEDSVPSFNQLKALLDSPGGEWWISAGAAGEQVGRAWVEIPGKITALLAQGAAGTGPGLRELTTADRLARQTDAEGALRIAAADPVAALRRLRLHNLLLEYARRSYRDHWYADKGSEPYYAAAMRKCVEDAETLAGGGTRDASQRTKAPNLAAVNQVRALIKAEPLRVTSPELVHWTSEQSLDFPYVLEHAAEVLPGYPVLWRAVEGGSADDPPLGLAQGKPNDRFVANALGDEPPQRSTPFPIAAVDRWLVRDEAKPPEVPTREPAKVILKGVFRGQEINRPIDVALHRVPHRTAVAFPRRPVGGIALQSDPNNPLFAKNNGVLILVLDQSISMTSKLGNSTRLKESRKALEEVLQSLPDGLVVSIWDFGTTPTAGFPIGSQPWMKQVWKPQPWAARQLDEVKALIEKETPDPKGDVGSPVAHTIAMAARTDLAAIARDFPESAKGFKTLLALTDGDDNSYAFYQKGARDLPGDFLQRELKDYLQQSPTEPGLQLNLVFFADNKKDVASARQQFGAILKLPVPGKFYEFNAASSTDNLAAKILDAVQQQYRCRLEHADGKPVGEGSPLDRFPSWFTNLKPSLYTLRLQTFKQDVEVRPDDFIQVSLLRRKDKIAFERTLIGKVHPTRDRLEAGGWLLAAHQNRETPAAGLEMMTTLESLAVQPTERGTLLQYRPSFVWFDLLPGQAKQPFWLRWHNLERYPAPAWQLATGRWPSGATPQLQAWWLGDRAAPPVARELARDPQKPLGQDWLNLPVQVGEDTVQVESVRVEKRPFPLSPSDARDERACLVVRLRYPAGKPFLARLGKVETPYEEHRLYSEASKYTGIFCWPDGKIPEDFSLQLVSLEDVQRAAKDAGTTGTLGKLGAPVLLDAITIPKAP